MNAAPTASALDAALLCARTLGRPELLNCDGWRLTRRLASGRFTHVFRASHAIDVLPALGDFVIKALLPELAGNRLACAILQREALVSRLVRHANLTAVLADRTSGSRPYLVLPYFTGVTVQQLSATCICDRNDREVLLPLATACSIVRQTAEAVAELHEHGWIHGDIAPANVLMARSGHTTLLDLGLARRIGSDECRADVQLAGTPGYLPPEILVLHGRLSPAADVYSLGVLLFELATGLSPFHTNDATNLARLHREQSPPDLRELRPGVSRELAELVRRMLAKQPLRRPSAEEVARWLAEIEIAEFAIC